jgi:nitrile hydratase
MNGIHDMGGMDGFGKVEAGWDEPVFHERWEARTFAMTLLTTTNAPAVRHANERIAPGEYLRLSYFGRWARSLEARLTESGVIAPGEVDARIAGAPVDFHPAPSGAAAAVGSLRTIGEVPRFRIGDRVRTRNLQPHGHTRLPSYARGHCGIVAIVHPAFVFPDTYAHGLGENPQHVYAVRFDAAELWGDSAEPGTSVCLDCYESYLEGDD